MSSVSSLMPQASVQGGTTSVDDQIKALEKRVAENVKSGKITADQGKALTKTLEEVKKVVDDAATNGSLSATDKAKISHLLRDVGRSLSGAAQGGKSQSANGGLDADGDADGSTGATTLA